jgi:segregation and condensation protein B
MSDPDEKRPAEDASAAQPRESAPQHVATDPGLSLDQLSEAFAEMLTSGSDPYIEGAGAAASSVAGADLPVSVAVDQADAETDVDVTPASILEALLFVGQPDGSPLTARQVAALMRGVRPAEIDDLVSDLNDRYAADGRPYTIASAGDGYRMEVTRYFRRIRDKISGRTRRVRLSQAAIEVLAIVAYNAPLSRRQISEMREGKECGHLLALLVRRNLLRVERSKENRRRVLYLTTDRFLKLFGLESLEDLPRRQETDRQ